TPLLTPGWNGKPKWELFFSIRHLIGQLRSKWMTAEVTLRFSDTKARINTRPPIRSWQTALLEVAARLLRRTGQSHDLVDQSQDFVRTRGLSMKARSTR